MVSFRVPGLETFELQLPLETKARGATKRGGVVFLPRAGGKLRGFAKAKLFWGVSLLFLRVRVLKIGSAYI